MWCRSYFMLACAILLQYGSNVDAQRGSSCRTPNGEWARCISIYDCSRLRSVLSTKDAIQLRFLRESQCGYDSPPLVCCGTSDNYHRTQPLQQQGRRLGSTTINRMNAQFSRNPALPDRGSCGYQDRDRIYGGDETGLQEFPWMALLQYRNASGVTRWACGGTLINTRYVLTAAHCITGLSSRIGKLITVRLGEHNLNTLIDCKTPQNCNRRPVDINIESTIPHNAYNPDNKHHDIGLIRLSTRVRYSNFIRPICLPEPTEEAASGEKVVVAGWGLTEQNIPSPVKLKLQLPIHDKASCSRIYARVSLGESQICAGGQEGKDSCSGDSGGPLMNRARNDSSQWYLEGVVSGGNKCGLSGWPGIYTKVASYLEWIHGTVKN